MALPLAIPGFTADAYLQWAVHTGFRYYRNGAPPTIVLLVEFQQPLKAPARDALNAAGGIWISRRYLGFRFVSVTISLQSIPPLIPPSIPQQLANLQVALQRLSRQGARRGELAAPIAPPGTQLETKPRIFGGKPRAVIGIIDDGCPFAHRFYRPGSPQALSVSYLWDQGGKVMPGPAGPVATPFAYGAAYGATELNTILALATTPSGVVDEDTAYAMTGLPSLRGATSHGSQVMSHVAGKARPAYHVTRPAPPALPPLPARTDLVFVQLPADALDDPSGGWLEHYALDGMHAVHSYGRFMNAAQANLIVVNLSYGPQTGPHDGSSMLERAIDELSSNAVTHGYQFYVTLPSGNTNMARTHAEFNLASPGGAVDWFVAPDTQVPAFLEIWLPQGVTPTQVQIDISGPGVAALVAQPNDIVSSPNQTLDITAVLVPAASNRTLVLVAMAPTAHPARPGGTPHALATPGRWRVSVTPTQGTGGVADAYLARNDPNMGRARLGHSGYLDIATYDRNRFMREDEQLVAPPLPGSPIPAAGVCARGSFSGIATGAWTRVAAGYRYSDTKPANYSSGGPCHATSPRAGPDWAYATEESRVFAGRLGGGNRSATMVRLTGTSIAAPQYARELTVNLGAPLPAVAAVPGPPPWLNERAGGGFR
ncbi:MAG: hypothetical protein EOP82_06875 [Variovorax sp.]|nr:MAG: hypothetical protein EOP82_06875 [Variovorax sp.]